MPKILSLGLDEPSDDVTLTCVHVLHLWESRLGKF